MKFTIYSKPDCQYCDLAKALLQQRGLAYQEVHLDVGQPKDDGSTYITREELLSLIPSARSMPQVMIEEDGATRHLGGFTELKKCLTD